MLTLKFIVLNKISGKLKINRFKTEVDPQNCTIVQEKDLGTKHPSEVFFGMKLTVALTT